MGSNRRLQFAFTALAVALCLPARAGVVLKYEDDARKRTTLELDGKKLRSSSDGSGHEGDSAIFDGEKHVLYSLDDRSKTYRRMDEASATEMAKGFEDAMEKYKARMTPEQRAQAEAMLAKQKSRLQDSPTTEHTWKFERAAGGQKVAGYACDNYRVMRDGKLESEGCFVPWSAGALEKKDLEPFQEMGRFFERTSAAMGASLGQRARTPRTGDWLTGFVETAPGFPAVLDRVDEHGKRTRETRLVSLERTSLSAARFTPPSDYRETPMNMRGGD